MNARNQWMTISDTTIDPGMHRGPTVSTMYSGAPSPTAQSERSTLSLSWRLPWRHSWGCARTGSIFAGRRRQDHDPTCATVTRKCNPRALIGYKAYDAESLIDALDRRAITAVIPPKANGKVKRDCDFALY
jgi:hypothetical protein